MEVKITVSLSGKEALALIQEAEDIAVGRKPALHEFLDRIAEVVEIVEEGKEKKVKG